MPPLGYGHAPLDAGNPSQRQFKRHKILPRPLSDIDQEVPRRMPDNHHDSAADTSRSNSSASQSSSPRLLKHRSPITNAGPDLPPTPPVQSQSTSSGHSEASSSPTMSEEQVHKPENLSIRAPVTPPDPASPPTPDVTPPQTQARPRAVRPTLGDRGASRNTTMDSRTESFKTAREEPYSEEEEDAKSTIRPSVSSRRSSQATVRRVSDNRNDRFPQPQALGLALARITQSPEQSSAPHQLDGDWASPGEVENQWDDNLQRMVTVKNRDASRGSARQPKAVLDDKVATQTDATRAVRHMALHENIPLDNPAKTVSRQRITAPGVKTELPASREKSKATAAAKPDAASPLRKDKPRSTTSSTRSNSVPSSKDNPRSIAASTKSDTSTVVEAILVTVAGPPRRQQTLRHVRKQRTLRDLSKDSLDSMSSSLNSDNLVNRSQAQPRPRQQPKAQPRMQPQPQGQPQSQSQSQAQSKSKVRPQAQQPPSEPKPQPQEAPRSQPQPRNLSQHAAPRPKDQRTDSFASCTTTSSLTSNRARREVWKSGAIPVVVIPDRRSSNRSKSREPSLRSTSSRRSGRANSIGSAPLVEYIDSDSGPVFERKSRHSRRFSESDSRDQRTMDFPPVVPVRSSSLSAPTSRNTSRAGSMKADSMRARNALQQEASAAREPAPAPDMKTSQPKAAELSTRLQAEAEKSSSRGSPNLPVKEKTDSAGHPGVGSSDREDTHDRLGVDHHDDAGSSKKYSSRNTPFSTFSFETNGTAPEVSEAMAVQMYPHQNSSVVMVDHSSRPSDASDDMSKRTIEEYVGQPRIVTTAPDQEEPTTPPQQYFSLEDVDSPLRNPRAPPEPPANPPAINFIPATPSGLTPAHDKAIQMGNYFETMGEKPGRRPSLVKRALTRRRRLSLEYPPAASKTSGFLTRTFSLTRSMRRASDAFSAQPKPDMEGHMTYPQAEDKPAEEDKLHPFWRPPWAGNEFDDFDGEGPEDHRDDMVFRYPPVDNRPRHPKRTLSERMKRTFAILPIEDDGDYPADDWHGPERRTIRRTPSGNLRVVRHSMSAESIRRRRSQFGRPLTGQSGDLLRGMSRIQGIQRRRSKDRSRRFSIGATLGEIQSLPRRLSEKRREKRSQELRSKISGPREVRDGVEEMLRSNRTREPRYMNGDI
ncbi:hypothetical protein B0I35DRAFT_405312 [Stachybotrys elegans]|uniref:Uncharacterized protein n=1 Tax=Stachybotrys elegans TaxID=80388 RepID=A0A8K0WVB3_9HYPO|nr:hypothetical protein B0I35DRAFT_405312 [Stachybotrys elegans]